MPKPIAATININLGSVISSKSMNLSMASKMMKNATESKKTPLTNAPTTSARTNLYVNFFDAFRLDSKIAIKPMTCESKSLSMWNESANNANEWMTIPVINSQRKNVKFISNIAINR